MALIEWQDSYSVGVKLIDEQHKKLFTLLNDLYSAMKEGKDKVILGDIINGLAEYVPFHFTTEESYFDKFNYEGKDAHKIQHQIYIDKIKSYQEAYRQNTSFLSFDIIDFLEDWILGHVTYEDKKYTECFNKHGLN